MTPAQNSLAGKWRVPGNRAILWSIIAGLGLAVFFIFTYRYSWIGLPRADHFWLMGERAFSSSEWNYWVRLLSFNHSRVLEPGDYTLFRPGTTGTLALLDIFFRENFYAQGIFSLLFHLSAIGMIYLIANRATKNRGLSVALSAVLLALFPGYLAVSWRHISPYILCCVFLGAAAYHLCGTFPGNKKPWVTMVFLFLSTIFHEVAVFACLGLGGISLLTALINKFARKLPANASRPFFMAAQVFLIPVALYVALNKVSVAIYQVPVPRAFYFYVSDTMLFDVLALGGYFVLALLFPTWSKITATSDNLWWHADLWSLPHRMDGAMFALGGLVFFLLAIQFGVAWRKIARGQSGGAFGALSAMLFTVLAVGLASGRTGGSVRAYPYLTFSSYYFYLSSFFLLLNLIFALSLWRPSTLKGKAVVGIVAGLALLQAGFSSLKIQDFARTQWDSQRALAEMVWTTTERLQALPGHCLLGMEGAGMVMTIPELVLWRYSCSAREGKKQTPVCLSEKNGEVTIFSGNPGELPPYPDYECTKTLRDKIAVGHFALPQIKMVDPLYRAHPRLR